MGRVFEVADSRGRHYALKLSHENDRYSNNYAARLRAEYGVIRAMDHPYIIKAHDAGQTATGQAYYTMDLVRGQDIRDLLLGSTRRDRLVIYFGRQIAEALAHIHNRGYLHRDIKPANVMVASDGNIRLIDFGLSRYHESTGMTVQGSIMGSPSYLAPEQIRAEPLDNRTDIYALGIAFYELLQGLPPFRKNQQGILWQHLQDRPELPTNGPAALRGLIMRMLEKSPLERPQSAEEIAYTLEGI